MKKKIRAVALAAAVVAGGGVAPLALAGPAAAATGTCSVVLLRSNHYVPATDTLNPVCLMSYGAQSNAVVQLQWSLNTCYHKGLSTDGEFGTNTRNALRAVQDSLNIDVDGKYGPQTARAMKHQGANGAACARVSI